MQQWMKTGIFAVLVIGMVIMSGCISPVSTSTAPVTPSITPVVDENLIVIQAPAQTTESPTRTPEVMASATAVPTAATPVPAPANPALTPATAVSTVNVSGYNITTNIYDSPPSTVSVEGVTGTLLIHVGAGSGDGLTAYIARNGTNVPPVDASFDHYRSAGEHLNPDYLHVKIMPDGNSAIVNLMPGSYLAYLPDRSGGQPEERSFMINPRYLTYVTFTGHAAGSSGGCGC